MKNLKTIVIYKSNYGATKDYASWIAQELDCECKSIGEIKPSQIAAYDTVIFGGGLYAGGINGIKLVKKHCAEWKHTIVFMVGAAPAGIEGNVERYVKVNFGEAVPKNIDFYYFSGKTCFEKMSGLHKVMMKMAVKMLNKKPEAELTDMNKEMMNTMLTSSDRMDKSLIQPLVEKARQITKNTTV